MNSGSSAADRGVAALDRATGVLAAEIPLADRTNMVHAGTLVAHGTGRAVVVATGAASAVGQIATLLATRRSPVTPLQRRLTTSDAGYPPSLWRPAW